MAQALQQWAPTTWPVADDWRPLLETFLASAAGQDLAQAIRQRLAAGATIYPPQPFHALALTSLAAVRVVILGQDPYHGAGQAQGLAFSVASGHRLPPSLRNIFKELARDPAVAASGARFTGSLQGWARQGVLLLNTCLTVEAGRPASHARLGWDGLIDALLCAVAQRARPVVFMLWGAHAQARQALLERCRRPGVSRPLVLTANHPSPLSALRPPQPFIGCGHFGAANAFLTAQGCAPIDWRNFDDEDFYEGLNLVA